jgi:hypothetical protein
MFLNWECPAMASRPIGRQQMERQRPRNDPVMERYINRPFWTVKPGNFRGA